MRTLIFLFFIAFSLQTTAQKTVNKKDVSGNLIGYTNRAAFKEAKFSYWFDKNYKEYQPDKKLIAKLKKNIKNVSIISFVGTWCHDSKRELPRFYKIMDAIDFDYQKNFKLITISRSKRTPDNLQAGYNIKRTPTFIFYKKGKEIGRFVEFANQTTEKDFLRILKGKPYKPNDH